MKKSATVLSLILLSVSSIVHVASAQENSNETMPDKLTTAIESSRYQILVQESTFAGNGVDWLLEQANQAQFFLIGEEHGIAENPLLAAQLFESLSKSGYQHVGIEVSPYMANHLDTTLKTGGLSALEASYDWGTEPAFFGMKQEAQMLERIRNASQAASAFWGLDYEVAGDKLLINKLMDLPKPDSAIEPLNRLNLASEAAWKKYMETKGPQFIFSFSGDPQLVADLQSAWPNPAPEAKQIMHSLYETLSINRYWVSGQGWKSNERRANLFRSSFLGHWRNVSDKSVKVMFKLGASHLMRGITTNNTYDLGALLPEVAALNQTKTFSVLVLPGEGSQVAVLDPTEWVYRQAPAKDGYSRDLSELFGNTLEDGYTVFDLKPLRDIVFNRQYRDKAALRELVMRFDAVLIMTGSAPSSQLKPR